MSRAVWAQACEACDESAVVVRLSVWRRMAPAAGLRSNPDAGAATTSLLERHPYTRAAGMGHSNATDRADLSRREHSLRPTSGFALKRRAQCLVTCSYASRENSRSRSTQRRRLSLFFIATLGLQWPDANSAIRDV